MKEVLENQLRVLEYFENRIPEEIDWGDSAMNNYERFLEHTANLGFYMPVDSEEYFYFWNYIYTEIARQLKEYHENY